MKSIMKKNWERASAYTLAVAEAMPENGYESRPASTVWTYRELVHHIAYGLQWMNDVYVRQIEQEWSPGPVPETRKATLQYLKGTLDTVNATLDKDPNEKTIEGFYFMLEHNAHHRGQATTYLRCQGIEPPGFPF